MVEKYNNSFDFHKLVILEISSDKRTYIDYLSREFNPCKSDNSLAQTADIRVSIGRFPCKNDWKQDHYFRKLFRVRYNINNLKEQITEIAFQGDWTINFYPPIMGTFLQTSVIEPVIYYKCLRKKSILLHSACVSNGKEAFLFVASGGSGKTTTALQLANRGLELLGDDLIFITQDGMALPYPRPLHLFSYVLGGLPFLKLGLGLRFTLLWKDLLRAIISKVTGEKFYIATRVPLKNVMPAAKIGESAPIAKLFLLSKGSTRQLSNTHETREEVAKRIIEAGDINQILKTHILSHDPKEKEMVENTELQIVSRFLENVKEIYEINTHVMDEKDWAELAYQLRTL